MGEPVALDRRKLFEQVATYLERDILAGILKPGDRLPPERDLQQRFGVGRPAIREALIMLQRSGLVELRNGAAARVATPTAHNVVAGMVPAVQQMLSGSVGQRQLQGVRLFMEVGLVRHAASNASAEELDAFRQALDANRAAIGNMEEFIRTDVGFHYCLAKMMRNPAFTALHDAMSTWLEFQRRVALQEPGEDQRSYEAHARIFETVAARDPDAAEQAMRQHLQAGWVSFWHRIEDNERPQGSSGPTNGAV
jgi:GntR family transcriptional repressor for pyruvate dehydrogenase complex